MLSAATLERVSVSYRNGYYDGHAGKHSQYADDPEAMRPFGEFDYQAGYKAGSNDRRWSDTYAAERAARFRQQCG